VSASIESLIPELQPYARDLVDAAGVAGLQPRITSTRRSYADQKRLYARYLAGLSPYPAAPPGHSAHEYGWAFDMVVSPLSSLADVGAYWQQNGGIWGGTIGDDVHFEYPGFKEALGPTIDAAQAADDYNPTTLDKIMDVGISFAGPVGEALGGMELVQSLGFTHSEAIDLLTHPSKAVHKYPWLRLLGPPFIFFGH